MDFLTWKKTLLDSIDEIGFNATYRKFHLCSAALRNIVNGEKNGDNYVGLNSWKRNGLHLKADSLKDKAVNQ